MKKRFMAFMGNEASKEEIKREEAEKKINALKEQVEIARDREHSFIRTLADQLENIYFDAKGLATDAQDPSWKETITKYIEDAVKITAMMVAAGGMGVVANFLTGKRLTDAQAATSFAIPAVLCALWKVNKEHELIAKARGFLALVEDVKHDPMKIKHRWTEIAEHLCRRFQPAIAKLPASESGGEQLAKFFCTAIVRDFPSKRQMVLDQKLSAAAVIQLAVDLAIPFDSNDPLYSNWFTHKRLENIDREDWTVPGLLLRSPILDLSENQYYVRDGKLGKENRADKYPPQKIYSRPSQRYIKASAEEVKAIRIKFNPLGEQLASAEKTLGISKESLHPVSSNDHSFFAEARRLEEEIYNRDKVFDSVRAKPFLFGLL